ncbi:hypothetical protein CVT24_004302 [Panaeolus cyanescens]|uniref:Fibronectin type-III domain-containing protein n=1 Tax=Panaeolus cyanescens TaxID=181874 RepID=A0A409VA65_9AGAR|nr:hypothetical protein CVT24_004302 [Panaeolus cyanescens]
MRSFKLWLPVVLFSVLSPTSATQVVTPFLPQVGGSSSIMPGCGQPLPVPTTEQCEVININWDRSTAQGPNPTAPYFLHVYTSAYITPFIIPAGNGLSFDWAVPFAPGTQYQICMFDKFGNTGGCQATYTVIPPLAPPTCANITFPPLLDVTAEVENGPMSQYGWIDQCTDISITPKNGTPPYILTVAPALHPPYNITSHDNKPINWTVSLSWASAFFISLVDSEGGMWTNGPLHSAGGGTTACLAGNITDLPTAVKPGIAIGSGIGGLVVGLAFGFLGMYLILSRRYKEKLNADRFVHLPSGAPGSPTQIGFDYPSGSSHYRPVPTSSPGVLTLNSHPSSIGAQLQRQSSNYQVEPFLMPDEQGRMAERQHAAAHSPTSHPGPAPSVANESHSTAGASPPSQLYVLHHDSQMPPVTIFHQSGTQIVELPPRYPPGESSRPDADLLSPSEGISDVSRTETAAPLSLHQPRQPGQIRKLPREP